MLNMKNTILSANVFHSKKNLLLQIRDPLHVKYEKHYPLSHTDGMELWHVLSVTTTTGNMCNGCGRACDMTADNEGMW